MTSSNLRRWMSPFPWKLNMKGDCETYQGSWSTGVEYYSMCISLVFGSLSDVVGNIKSSMGLRALIWIVKTAFAVNGMQQREMHITHPTDCESNQWIFDQREMKHPMKDFQLKSAISFKHTESEEAAFVSGKNIHTQWVQCIKAYHVYTVCIMNLIYAGEGCPGSACSTRLHCANEKENSPQMSVNVHGNAEMHKLQTADYWSAFRHGAHTLIIFTVSEVDVLSFQRWFCTDCCRCLAKIRPFSTCLYWPK